MAKGTKKSAGPVSAPGSKVKPAPIKKGAIGKVF